MNFMTSFLRFERLSSLAPRPRGLLTDAECEITLCAMGVHRQNAPDHLICPWRQRLESHMQLCRVATVDLRLATGHHGAALTAHFNTAKGGLQLLSEPQCHFTRPCRLRTSNSRVGVIQHGMGQRGRSLK